MKTLQLSSIALLFFALFSCTKEEGSELLQEQQQNSLELGVIPLADANMALVTSACPNCVADFAASTATASSNAVYLLNNSTGALSPNGTTITAIASTSENFTVDNVTVTVSHDASNIYFTLERNNPTGGFGNFKFYSPALIPIQNNSPNNTGVPAGTKKIQIVRPRNGLSACSEISFSFSVGGGGSPSVAGSVTTPSALSYLLRDICPPKCNIQIGDYRTQTRGYWRNKNGLIFLSAHSSLFPFKIGCSDNTQSFDDATEIKNYLEAANGTPSLMPSANTFSAQVLTLLINVSTDEAVADFGAAAGKLSDLKVDIDDAEILAHPEWASLTSWNGKTIAQILTIAQNVLGGCSSDYTASDVNSIVTAINENFDNGTINNGLLTCGN